MSKQKRISNRNRRLQSSPLNSSSSIQMRQNSEVYRQTVIRYDENEITDLLKLDEDFGKPSAG